MDVPYVDLAAEYRGLRDDIDEAVAGVLASGHYVLGENVAAFEEEFARWVGTAECAAVGSGTDAIYLTLKALGIGDGAEVITVSHTAVNSALAISKTGAVPVLVDIDPGNFCLNPELLEAALTERTRALMPVHLYGHPADMDPVLEFASAHGLTVIEDCAQSHGAEYKGRRAGTMGAAGCFSFYPTKNLGACGDGGAVTTSDAALAAKIRSLANCGQGDERYHNIYRGEVSRLDELQAAILRVKLKRLDEWTERRRAVAAFYREHLGGITAGRAATENVATGGAAAGASGGGALMLPAEKEWARHVYHLYVIRSKKRDALRSFLADRSIQSLIHYPVPVHLQPAYADEQHAPLPETEKVVGEILSLPCFPEITDEQLETVAAAVKAFFG